VASVVRPQAGSRRQRGDWAAYLPITTRRRHKRHDVRVATSWVSRWACLTVLAAGSVLLAACGGDKDEPFFAENGPGANDNLADCSEWAGRDVEQAEVAYGCDQGQNNIAGTAVHECDDGRTLYWNDAGWGYVGEPMHVHAPDQELVAPAGERAVCGVA
jgi:hypothetical protein